eukprot:TRINITY_DN6578_c0_g1_i1.p1 TRINITY_DN6578_c0_g1~~TRINITY_DN6578_c0_g1_i1.p1  ORF type:complete len:603 (+),score=148.30 TRINITY_DN6578_c0_g1_i1:145-1809(+)
MSPGGNNSAVSSTPQAAASTATARPTPAGAGARRPSIQTPSTPAGAATSSAPSSSQTPTASSTPTAAPRPTPAGARASNAPASSSIADRRASFSQSPSTPSNGASSSSATATARPTPAGAGARRPSIQTPSTPAAATTSSALSSSQTPTASSTPTAAPRPAPAGARASNAPQSSSIADRRASFSQNNQAPSTPVVASSASSTPTAAPRPTPAGARASTPVAPSSSIADRRSSFSQGGAASSSTTPTAKAATGAQTSTIGRAAVKPLKTVDSSPAFEPSLEPTSPSSGGTIKIPPPKPSSRMSVDYTNESDDVKATPRAAAKKSGKDALLAWCAQMTAGYPSIPPGGVQNFHNDWKSGIALAAIIHRFNPKAISWREFDFTQSEAAYTKNLQIAIDAAKGEGIPELMDLQDYLISPRPDVQCVITQVSEYYQMFNAQEPIGKPPKFEVVASPSAGAAGGGGGTVSRKSAPMIGGGGGKNAMSCARCNEPVFDDEPDFVEIGGKDGEARLHKKCFNCYTCGKEFRNVKNAVFVDSSIYCDACGRKAFIALTLRGGM